MSTSRESDAPLRIEKIPLERISPRAAPIEAALDATGAAWVSFERAWMSKIERDGRESARVILPRNSAGLVCDSADNVLIAGARWEPWRGAVEGPTYFAFDANGEPLWETRAETGFASAITVDANDRLIGAGNTVFAVTAQGMTVELPYWSTSVAVDPITGLLWRSSGVSVERVDELSAVVRGERKTPAPSVTLWDASARATAFAPSGGAVWMISRRTAKKLAMTVLRRVRPTEPKGSVAGGAEELVVPFDNDARAMVATRDGGFWVALNNGDLVKCDAAGAVTHRARAGADPGWNNDALRSLTVTRDGRTAAALSTKDNALIRVTV